MLLPMIDRLRLSRLLPFAIAALALLALYLPVLQTIPNGSDHYYMVDVGETQIVLNVWGTLHATGYPLYVMTGNALVALLRALGVAPATAPGVVSLIWSLVALGLMFALALRLGGRAWIAAVIVAFGLTRTVWIHAVIAEVYSFGLALLALLYLIALGPPLRGRVYWLALTGGIAVAQHRAFAVIAPALVLAAWQELVLPLRRLPVRLVACLLLGLSGFLPYLYLPLRAHAGAAWVYGEPGTWSGFWDQFWGREASRFIGSIDSVEALLANITSINTVLLTDLTLPGLLLGLLGLAFGIRNRHSRKPALVLALSALLSYLFHITLYSDILSALILQITFSLAFGWLFLIEALARALQHRKRAVRFAAFAMAAAIAVVFVGALVVQNQPFIEQLTGDRTGLETISLAEHTPPGATLMIPWGSRHFAVGFARDVLGMLDHLQLVDHKANFRDLAADGLLVTPEYTFYNHPVTWWQEQIGAPVYLSAAAPSLVQISLTPERAPAVNALDTIDSAIECHDDAIWLRVTWASPQTPEADLSVFVHLLDDNGAVIAQADQSAPVYGWRPLTGWLPGEAVSDIYALPAATGASTIRYGLYYQRPDESFENVLEYELPVTCAA